MHKVNKLRKVRSSFSGGKGKKLCLAKLMGEALQGRNRACGRHSCGRVGGGREPAVMLDPRPILWAARSSVWLLSGTDPGRPK